MFINLADFDFRSGGWREQNEGGGRGGRKKVNWSYGMAGWTGNEVISPAW